MLGSKIAEAYVEVKTNQAKFTQELGKLERSVKTSVDKMKRSFDQIGRGVSEISGIARYGFLGMVAAIAGVTYEAQKEEKAVAKLVQQLKNHGEATQGNIDALTGLASALQRTTQFGDEQIIAGQAMLASFNLTTQQIKELTPHLLNLAIMTENTTGQQADLASVAKMVGVALGGQAGRLVQMGIAITEAQKKTLALANADEKINILMEIFQENAGGLAEATGKTLAGSLSKAKNAMSDLAEELGFLLEPVIVNACAAIVDKMSEWKEAVRSLTPEQKKLITQIVFLGTAALGAIGALGLFSTLARVVQAAGLIIAGTFGLITSPLGLIMLAVGALALAWTYNWGDIQGKTKAVWEFLKPIFQGIWDWLSDIGKEMEETTDTFKEGTEEQVGFWQNILKVFKVIGLTFIEIFKEMGAIAKEILKAMGFDWDKFVEGLKDDIENIRYWLTKGWEWSLDKVKGAWDWFINNVYPGLIDDFQNIWYWLHKGWDWSLNKVKAAWKWFEDTLIPFLEKWGKATLEWTLEKAGTVWDTIMDFFGGVKDWIKLKFSWTLEKVGPIWDAIIGFFADAKDWLVKKFSWTLEKAGEMWDWFTNTLIPMLWTWSETTFHWLLELGGTVWDKFKDIMQWVKERATMAFNWSLIKIGETWDWLTGKLWPWLKEWGVKAFEWGLQLIGNIWNWLKDILIPWVLEWKEKTFEWTLKLLGDAWEKIKQLLEWLKIIPKEMEGVAKVAEKTGKAIKQVAPVAIIKDLSHLESVIRGQKVALEYASKEWRKYSQVTKRQIAATAASFILFKKGITDIAAKAPYEFSDKFQKNFMKAKPKIQKAILDALTSGDFERALSLAGVKAGKAFLGQSPGMLTELEEGTKETKKLLDKMLGSMDDMTKKIMKIFQPIVGLFKTVFDAILKIVEKFSPEAAAEIRALVDDVMVMMEGLFNAVEKRQNKWFQGWALLTDKGKSLWQKFCDIIGKVWGSICEAIRASFSDAMVAVIAGTQTVAEAFQALQKAVAVELAKIAVEALKTKDVLTGVLTAATAAFVAFGIRIRATTTHFETAWGTLGRSMALTTMEMGENMLGFTDLLETEFNRVGLAISKTIEDAQYKLEGLYQSQADLGASTREKLIDELDKYYDYRWLKEKSLDELLALSADTRVGIETGAIKEVAESEEEQEARRKDQAVSRLQQIEDNYRREDELMRRKIALTEIEIKFLELKAEREAHHHSERAKQLEAELDQMLASYHESVEAYEEAEKKKQKATKETAKTTEEATKDMAKSTETAADEMVGAMDEAGEDIEDSMDDAAESIEDAAEDMVAAIERATRDLTVSINNMTNNITRAIGNMARAIINAINDMVNKIRNKLKEIPDDIYFDIWGKLHMPSIPSISSQSFDIFGKYIAPSIPSYQTGTPYVPRTTLAVLHRGEEVVPAHRARAEGGQGGTQIVYERGAIRMFVQGSINQQVDLNKAMDYLARKQAEKMRRP